MRVSGTYVLLVCLFLAVPVFAAPPPGPPAKPGDISAVVTYGGLQQEPALSYSFGVVNSSSDNTGGGGGAGKATFSNFTFVKNFNSQSVTYVADCTTGKHISTVTIDLLDKKGNVVAEIKLSDVIVQSYQTSSGSGDLLDSISLNFAKIDFVKVLIGL